MKKSDFNLEYKLLDTGNFRKLEQVGPWKLIRPALNACWNPMLSKDNWLSADAEFLRDSSGHGKWKVLNRPLPENWVMRWGNFNLHIKPTSFGHLGFFAEQYQNWEFFEKIIPTLGKDVKTMNLFAYSGIGSMAMARAGALVSHLDASRGMVEWGRINQSMNDDVPDRIRWIVDDVNKFCKRELRRGNRYRGIALDPPSFGRGSAGQLWKIDDQIIELLAMCRALLEKDGNAFVTLSCHSPGFTPLGLERLLESILGKGSIQSREMTIPEATGRVLPAGITATWIRK